MARPGTVMNKTKAEEANIHALCPASAASVAIVKFFVQDFLARDVPFTSYITVEQSLIVPPILVLLGVALSAIAAKIAITRYLRV